MADWDPEQYLRFKQDRLRPACELLARVGISTPEIVVDIGCGPATTTRILKERFKAARIIGVDNSPDMIERARTALPDVEFVLEDFDSWQIEESVDLLYANAVFHWLPDHEKLLDRLAAILAPGGVLAFQMPDNLSEPSHLAIAELVQSTKWKYLFVDQPPQRTPVASINQYHDWLTGEYDQIDIWRTTYAHVMPDHQHIVDWVKGAALTQYSGALNDIQTHDFLVDYLSLIKKSYSVQSDGTVVFHIPRLFVVAKKTG